MKAFRALYGYNYVQCGWMGEIYVAVDGEIVYLKTDVSPSQPGQNRNNYTTWIGTKADGTIKTACCSCPAELGRSCSHVAALMYCVYLAQKHGGKGTCTDNPVSWGKGAKHVPLSQIGSIDFKRPRLDTPMSSQQMPSPSAQRCHCFLHPQTFEEVMTFKSTSPLRNMFDISGSLINHVLCAKPTADDLSAQQAPHCDHVMDSAFHHVDSSDSKSGAYYIWFLNFFIYLNLKVAMRTIFGCELCYPFFRCFRRHS